MSKKDAYYIRIRVGDPAYMPIKGKKIKFEQSNENGEDFILVSCGEDVIGLAETVDPEINRMDLPKCFCGTVVENDDTLVVKTFLERRDGGE